MRTTLLKPTAVGASITALTIAITGGLASAHIDPDPLAMQAGTSGTVGFTIEHGCNGSPTTSVTFQIPAEVSDIAPVEKDGWTATVTAETIEFKGGPLPADEEGRFELTIAAPAQAAIVNFPIIQTCEQGELAWIEVAAEGQEEPEHPAPALKVTDGPPTAADLAPEEEHEASDDAAAPKATSVIIAAPASTASDSSDDSSNTGVIVGVVIAAVVVLGGGGYLLVRRRTAAQGA